MASPNSRNPILEHLDAIEEICLKGNPTLKEIFAVFGPAGHYVLILFLTLPFLQPIPLPGLSIPFGIMIAIVGLFAFLEKPPVVPKRWVTRRLPAKTVLMIVTGSERIFKKLAPILHPRLNFFTRGPFRTLNMILLVFNAILLALPLLFPFTNSMPSLVILLQVLGILEEDGLFIILSYVQAILCLGYFILLGLGAEVVLESIWH